MKVGDNISDLYRRKVDELLDNQPGFILIKPLNQEELDEIWEEISTEMDIGEVWNDISADLDIEMPQDSGSGLILRSIAAVLIIMIGLIPVRNAILDSGIVQPANLTENKQNEQSAGMIANDINGHPIIGEQVKENISTALKRISDNNVSVIKSTQTEEINSSLKQITPVPEGKETISGGITVTEKVELDPGVYPDKTQVEKTGFSPFLISAEPEKIKIIARVDSVSMRTDDNSSSSEHSLPITEKGRISGGLITSFKNTWLLNYETLDGLRSKSLNTTEIKFYPDIGLSLNYSMNKNWLIQADGFFYSNTGQEYLEYKGGHYLRKKVTLRYSTISLSVKYKFSGREDLMRHFTVNLIAGGYLSVLNRADQKLDTELENIRSQYGKFDIGARLGSEIEFHFTDHFSLAPGLFFSLGIPNIYKGDTDIPGYLRTRNGSAGFNLTFYYHLD